MFQLRAATLDDVAALLPRTAALNAHEGIVIDAITLEHALRRLLADASLGAVWMLQNPSPIGYAIVTFGYDLEFGGRDAYLTELWIDEPARGRGTGAAALDAISDAVRALGVRALHLQVRPDNPAMRLYERTGFVASPRVVMTRKL